MDLDLNWEKKALIVLGVVTLIILIYAFDPFKPQSNLTVENQSMQYPVTSNNPNSNNVTTANNTTSNITSNTTSNTTDFKITKEQAKSIASEPGYTVGEPRGEIITINDNSYAVWVVPLLRYNKVVKEVVIDANTGNILETREIK
ncbi:MAG: PepSY domain-containing protein [Euryarchaeota archaeon]|nr:PepSY domain-containing protein [Euryarchaeota archaeon]